MYIALSTPHPNYGFFKCTLEGSRPDTRLRSRIEFNPGNPHKDRRGTYNKEVVISHIRTQTVRGPEVTYI